MIQVQVDEEQIKEIYLAEIRKKLELIDKELVYWDTNELKRRTKMCWNTIQKEFFYNPKFPKRKVGTKWYFPAKETEAFLLNWINERG